MIKVIIFDCMETLIEVKEIPDLRLYSSWAYHGSGIENYWEKFEDFYLGYERARNELGRKYGNNREYSLYQRFEYIVEKDFAAKSGDFRKNVVSKLARNFWKNYQENCFVDAKVRAALAELQQRYSLGVVSNFMISGGIEELLSAFKISQYFDFVITSIEEGWRKPAKNIYLTALASAGVDPAEILFVGDDYLCDYQGPKSLGIQTLLLDREGKYPRVESRISHLKELKDILL